MPGATSPLLRRKGRSPGVERVKNRNIAPRERCLEDDVGQARKRRKMSLVKQLTPVRGKVVSTFSSPSTEKLLSQDDSFLASIADQVDDSEDMFNSSITPNPAITDEENNGQTQGESQAFSLEDSIILTCATLVDSQGDGSLSLDTQGSNITLPLSVLDVQARALEEMKNPVERPKNILDPKLLNPVSVSKLVENQVDVGPFYGLPSLVKELYKKYKRVENLFEWQAKCMESKAVVSKSNLLYSLPTSSGKTLVAELIMLQELLCYKKSVIFVLPYVSLVQEKIRSLTPFALELGFSLEEYAGPKGVFPPIKRRNKRPLFICTIEKANALFNSLVAEKRLEELGLVVVDEVHMIGEEGRGAILETFLTKLKYSNAQQKTDKVQLVAMSATVGNLRELATFLDAELFTDSYRPVELKEYIKVERDVLEVKQGAAEGETFKFQRKLPVLSPDVKSVDGDGVSQLVAEVFPAHSVLVFCDTKKRCENLSDLIVKVMMKSPEQALRLLEHKKEEKAELLGSLKAEGFLCPVLARTVLAGVAYHHSGLTSDERKLIEEAFLNQVLGVICCTSTLAAGVNLPARRVIIRSPFMGPNQLTHAQYKQMAGRAGRAGMDTFGESFLLLGPKQVSLAGEVVASRVPRCLSSLHRSEGRGIPFLILNCLHLGLVSTPQEIASLMSLSLVSLQAPSLQPPVEVKSCVFRALELLLTKGLVSPVGESSQTQQTVLAHSQLQPSVLGRATIAGNIEITQADKLFSDLASARASLAVDTSLHLLYLLTPYDIGTRVVYTADTYHHIFTKLPPQELAVCNSLGVTEGTIVGLMRGRSNKLLQPTLARLYWALMLWALWQAKPLHLVADTFQVPRGDVQNLMSSAAGFASSVFHFCQEIDSFWAYQELLEPYSKRLAYCASPELLPLLDIPGVRGARARQLYAAGFSSLQKIAKTSISDLSNSVEHLPLKVAASIIQGATLLLTEKAEILKEEAEMVLLELESQ